MPGAKYRSLKKPSLYESLRADGRTKQSAAAISNSVAAKQQASGMNRGLKPSPPSLDIATRKRKKIRPPSLDIRERM